MTLRLRLFLFFGAFVAVLVAAQWWLVRSLAADLSRETDRLAMTVGASVAEALTVDLDCGDLPEGELCVRTVDLAGDDGSETGGRRTVIHALRHFGDASGRHEIHQEIHVRPKGGPVEGEPLDEETLHKIVQEIQDDSDSGDTVVPPGPSRRVVRYVIGADGEPVKTREDLIGLAETRLVETRLVETRAETQLETQLETQVESEGGEREIRLKLVGGEPGTRALWVERPDRIAAEVPIVSRDRAALESFQERLLLGSAGLVLVGLLLAAVIADRVSAPLRRLAETADEVGGGSLGARVAETGGDREIRGTLRAFNHMSERLVELEDARRRLEATRHMGELGDVARGLAHTLRNPLNALGLSVEELAARVGPGHDPGDDELVESARRQIRRLDRGIRSFLLLAGQSADDVVVEEVDVAELVKDVALEALQDAAGRARLDVHVAEGLDPRRLAVEPELRAVVQALVVNALEASPDGATVDVSVASAGDPERLVLRVDDRGPGLPTTVRERLFTPHLSTKPNGSGMGLFLAQRIAGHRYDGRLELVDRDDGGLRAELEIGPRHSLDPPADELGSPS